MIVRRAHKMWQIIFFCMSAAHERHLAFAVVGAREPGYTKRNKKKRWKRPGSQHRMELLTMATHALPSPHILDDADAASHKPSGARDRFARTKDLS